MEMEEEEMEREDLERDWRLKGERWRIWGKKKEVRWSLAPGEGEEVGLGRRNFVVVVEMMILVVI